MNHDSPDTLFQTALALHQQGQLTPALALYESILQGAPRHVDTLHMRGALAFQAGDFNTAAEFISRALSLHPGHITAHLNLALTQQALGRFEAALASFGRVLALNPQHIGALAQRSLMRQDALQHEAALADLEQLLALQPDNYNTLYRRGNTLRALGRLPQALASYEQSLQCQPDQPDQINTLYNRAVTLRNMEQPEAAVLAYEQVLQRDPRHRGALNNCALVLLDLQRPAAAVDYLARALQSEPDNIMLLTNHGNALRELNRLEAALLSYERVLQLDPLHLDSRHNRAVVLRQLQRYAEALEGFEQVLQQEPEHGHAATQALNLRQALYQWNGMAERSAALLHAIAQDTALAKGIPPFALLGLDSTAAEQQRCARQWAGALRLTLAHEAALPPAAGRDPARPLRIAYLSADFHAHATAYLMVAVFELHQQHGIDCRAYSYGADDGSPMRRRLQAAFTGFEDISALSARAAAAKIQADGIDILIDLKGYTDGCRSAILAFRPAPIQAQFLGYPGTMGSSALVDYLIADRFVIPPEQFAFYDEKIVYLPGSYQPNDPQRVIGPAPTRIEAGLPARGFVFCCFNQAYKITPAAFAQWLRLLHAVPGSVLWLLEPSAPGSDNLRRAAKAKGIDGARLIFAPQLPLAAHLGRLQLADLFLDTPWYNAHTSASDALWAGVPVLTCPGQTFASRVAGSLLLAMGLPELIADTPVQYETIARDLAGAPQRLAALRAKTMAARSSSSLFDAARFARALEAAYQSMWQRHQAGAEPAHFALTAQRFDVAAAFQTAWALHQQGDVTQALAGYQTILRHEPCHVDCLHLSGVIELQSGAYETAIDAIARAAALAPRQATIHSNLGYALYQMKRPALALASLEQALLIEPEHSGALCNRGLVLWSLHDIDAAIAVFNQVLAREPDHLQALNNRGIALAGQSLLQEAVRDYEHVLRLTPNNVETLLNCGAALQQMDDKAAAQRCFERVLQLAPERTDAAAHSLYMRLHLCQWDQLEARSAALRAMVAQQSGPIPPFGFMALATSAAEQQDCARQWSQHRLAALAGKMTFSFAGRRDPARPMRIAYLSSDLHEHATAYLMAAVFEAHRQHGVDCRAYSYGVNDERPMRQRLRAAFTRFDDISALSHQAAAEKIYADRIDILIDLKGYTQGNRSEILAYRAAPLQVQFLGYPGTMGTALVDYLIADRFVIPPEQFAFYDESIVYLPDSYQPNDPQRPIAAAPSRAEAGLPERGFVFCGFNQSYKITPAVLAQWLRLLHAVPHSVLWLLVTNQDAMDNLRRAAQAAGIADGRLIFAPQLALAAHLGRQQLADLFLDTPYYNAHTTASDALWAGVPVLTCPGHTFASRVAGSLLHAMGLPELIAATPQQYEAIARELAEAPQQLAALRAKIQAARASSTLFDAARFARNLEQAYGGMWQRYLAGAAAASFTVE